MSKFIPRSSLIKEASKKLRYGIPGNKHITKGELRQAEKKLRDIIAKAEAADNGLKMGDLVIDEMPEDWTDSLSVNPHPKDSEENA